MRTTTIARCVDGRRHRISGVVEATDPLRAPISGQRCVYWAITIDEVGKGDHVERGVADQGASFLVRDGSGIARVMPEGARLDLEVFSTLRRPPFAFDPEERALFTQLQIRLNYPRSSSVRFNERVLANGARITVFGEHQREPAQAAADADVDVSGYRGDLPMRPVFSSSRRRPLMIGASGAPDRIR